MEVIPEKELLALIELGDRYGDGFSLEDGESKSLASFLTKSDSTQSETDNDSTSVMSLYELKNIQ